MSNLQDDFGAALMATMNAASSRFTALGNTGGTLHIEYEGQPVKYGDGRLGKCLVRPLTSQPVPGTDFTESGQTVFPFILEFDLIDIKDAGNARTSITQAVVGTFKDRGKSWLTNFTDNGSNTLGRAIVLTIGDPDEDENGDPNRPHIEIPISIEAWHKVPMA